MSRDPSLGGNTPSLEPCTYVRRPCHVTFVLCNVSPGALLDDDNTPHRASYTLRPANIKWIAAPATDWLARPRSPAEPMAPTTTAASRERRKKEIV